MDTDISIKVNNISKSFKLPHEKNSSLKGTLINLGKRGYERQQVLEDISFDIKKGEFFGIVGRNGSGKSTLLRLLAGIYTPDSGNIEINGKLTPFIELGVGFNPELTGRENVFLNCALLGFSRKEVTAMYQDIVDFSELERFMDQKLKNYSSGMQVRLAFSVAIRAESDILLIDEVLAVGDQSFQEKCFNYFSKIKKSDKTVIFVTHDMSNVERFCDRVLVIDKKKEVNGLYTVPEAVAIYNELNHEIISPTATKERHSAAGLHIKRVSLLDEKWQPTENFKQGSPFAVEIEIEKGNLKENIPIVLGLAFHDSEDLNLSGPNSKGISLTSKDKIVTYYIDKLPFTMGNYYLTVALLDEKSTKQYDLINKGVRFFVNTKETLYGKIVLDGKWVKK